MIANVSAGSSGEKNQKTLADQQHYYGMFVGWYGCSRFVHRPREDLWLKQEVLLKTAPVLELPLQAEGGTATSASG